MSIGLRRLFALGIFGFVVVSTGASSAMIAPSGPAAIEEQGPNKCVAACSAVSQKCIQKCRWDDCGRKCPREHQQNETKGCKDCMAKCGIDCNQKLVKCIEGCGGGPSPEPPDNPNDPG